MRVVGAIVRTVLIAVVVYFVVMVWASFIHNPCDRVQGEAYLDCISETG